PCGTPRTPPSGRRPSLPAVASQNSPGYAPPEPRSPRTCPHNSPPTPFSTHTMLRPRHSPPAPFSAGTILRRHHSPPAPFTSRHHSPAGTIDQPLHSPAAPFTSRSIHQPRRFLLAPPIHPEVLGFSRVACEQPAKPGHPCLSDTNSII